VTQLSAFPALFQWARYHALLVSWKVDNEDEKLRQLPKDWAALLVGRPNLTHTFLREWLLYIRASSIENFLQWYPFLRPPHFLVTNACHTGALFLATTPSSASSCCRCCGPGLPTPAFCKT
jgi:hypothetical protein